MCSHCPKVHLPLVPKESCRCQGALGSWVTSFQVLFHPRTQPLQPKFHRCTQSQWYNKCMAKNKKILVLFILLALFLCTILYTVYTHSNSYTWSGRKSWGVTLTSELFWIEAILSGKWEWVVRSPRLVSQQSTKVESCFTSKYVWWHYWLCKNKSHYIYTVYTSFI